MAHLTRFRRKLALPSTRQIIHEFRVISAHEDLRRLEATKVAQASGDRSPLAVGCADVLIKARSRIVNRGDVYGQDPAQQQREEKAKAN